MDYSIAFGLMIHLVIVTAITVYLQGLIRIMIMMMISLEAVIHSMILRKATSILLIEGMMIHFRFSLMMLMERKERIIRTKDTTRSMSMKIQDPKKKRKEEEKKIIKRNKLIIQIIIEKEGILYLIM